MIKHELNMNNIYYSVYETMYPGHAKIIAKQITTAKTINHVIIVIGGDGTINEVINGIEDFSNVFIGIIPAGTGNDLAKMLNIPEDYKDAIQLILKSNYMSIDMAVINDSINMALFLSCGIAIDIINDCKKNKNKTKKSYVNALLKKFWLYNPHEYTISINEHTYHFLADAVNVQNAIYAGGGLELCNMARVDDGVMDLVIVEYKGLFRRLLNIIALLRKDLLSQNNVCHFVTNKISVIFDMDQVYCIDGELNQNTSVNLNVISKTINVFV